MPRTSPAAVVMRTSNTARLNKCYPKTDKYKRHMCSAYASRHSSCNFTNTNARNMSLFKVLYEFDSQKLLTVCFAGFGAYNFFASSKAVKNTQPPSPIHITLGCQPCSQTMAMHLNLTKICLYKAQRTGALAT